LNKALNDGGLSDGGSPDNDDFVARRGGHGSWDWEVCGKREKGVGKDGKGEEVGVG
jgi:hypothetical protein